MILSQDVSDVLLYFQNMCDRLLGRYNYTHSSGCKLAEQHVGPHEFKIPKAETDVAAFAHRVVLF